MTDTIDEDYIRYMKQTKELRERLLHVLSGAEALAGMSAIFQILEAIILSSDDPMDTYEDFLTGMRLVTKHMEAALLLDTKESMPVDRHLH